MFARIETSGADVRMQLYGALDEDGARALHAHAKAALTNPLCGLLLDLGGVQAIDEAGMAALLFLDRRLAGRRQRLRLTGVRSAWLGRLRDLGLAEPEAAAGTGRSRDGAAPRRPARGPEGE